MQDGLIRKIIDYYPYPVASVFKILMTDECLDPGPMRLQYIQIHRRNVGRFALDYLFPTPPKRRTSRAESRGHRRHLALWRKSWSDLR